MIVKLEGKLERGFAPWKAMVEPPIERFKKMYHQSQSDFNNRDCFK